RAADSPADFAATLDAAAADARARLEPVGATADKTARQMIEFESMILGSFVNEMIPKEKSGLVGTGFAGDMWRSTLAAKTAHQVARSGSLGIATRLFAAHALGHGSGQAFGSTSADSATPALSHTNEAASVSGAAAGGMTMRPERSET